MNDNVILGEVVPEFTHIKHHPSFREIQYFLGSLSPLKVGEKDQSLQQMEGDKCSATNVFIVT